MQLYPLQMHQALSTLIPAHMPVLLKGAPGLGKTDIVYEAAKSCGYDIIVSHPVVSDPTDAKGLPWPAKDGNSAKFLPFGELEAAINAKKPTVWFLDDLGQAPPEVQASFMQLLLARRINGHKLPDHVTFVAATNRRGDRAGVSGLLEPVKSRFATILELVTTVDDWCEWAISNDMPEELVAFMKFRGADLLSKFEPKQDIENSPSPRTWAAVGRMFKLKPAKQLRLAMFSGAVGEGAAGEFISFVTTYENMPDLDKLLANPKNAPVPTEVSTLWALSVALSAKATPMLMEPISLYLERLNDESQSEFAAFILRDISKRKAACMETKAFNRLASSALGKSLYRANAA